MAAFYPAVQRLTVQLQALGIPFDGVSLSNGAFTVHYLASATPAQIQQGNTLASGFDPRDYQSRTLVAIFTDINALTASQKTNAANDLFSGSPMKVLLDNGPNAAAIAVLFYLTQTVSLSAADIALAKVYAATMYVQDNPAYLIAPTFDPTISVAGWAPIT